MKTKNPFSTLSKFEWGLWLVSLSVLLLSFFLGGSPDFLTLAASLIGVTALLFVAKGAPLGQILTVVFSLLYALISLEYKYYGEMITYLGMTAPIAVLSVISWLRHPFQEKKSEVAVARLQKKQIICMLVFAGASTLLFYFILRFFHTPNLALSTVSITTSFLASYLTFCRSPYYALAYAANDIVLIFLWISAALSDPAYLPMVACFAVFLLNDLYGFFNWRRIRARQNRALPH